MPAVEKVRTVAYKDQKPGTSGLRKPTKVFETEKNYTENFIEAILLAQGDKVKGSHLIVGGDGRYYSDKALAIIISIAAAHQVKKLTIGRRGILSTPAVSHLIRKKAALGGIVLTASHNPGGPDYDFGIKYNISNGGPAPDAVTESIFKIASDLQEIQTCPGISVDLDVVRVNTFDVEGSEFIVEVIDSVQDYLDLMKEIFDFDDLRNFLKDFPILVNCLNGVTGPYAQRIFVEELQTPQSSVVNGVPLPDFGGLHPDPNLTYAKDLVDELVKDPKYQFGAAYDGDGDRNMLLGQGGFFVTPSDALAVIAANSETIKYFKGGLKGVARSMPTSMAIERVGEKLNLNVYEVPTGWKYFGNLMDAGKLSLCGEESFGLGSDHIREKDGIWASLAFLSILSAKKTNVEELLKSHWATYGRNYFQRLDYENIDTAPANTMMQKLEEKLQHPEELKAHGIVKTDNYEYVDIVDGSVAKKQGLRVFFQDSSRIVFRLSGTGSSGATVRIYLEKIGGTSGSSDVDKELSDLKEIAEKLSQLKEITGRTAPTVIT